jgi:hypothetical protein
MTDKVIIKDVDRVNLEFRREWFHRRLHRQYI